MFSVFWKTVHSDSRMEIILASPALTDKGREIYESHTDKSWSLTDCISFVIMRENSMVDALTADHHFEQAGFTAVLKQP